MLDNYTEQPIIHTLKTNYMPYAMSVIVSRAIPEIDGLKPSHRKLLYTMYKMGLLKGNKTKSANVVGQTMKLNPHGDMAIYETLVRLTTGNMALLHPLVESKGNFGRVYSRDMKYAAPRYTEVKLADIAEAFFRDIDKETVDFVDNYDGTMKEPVLLPVAFPNILVNPNQGIAVGMASNICSFNLREVCEATIAYIQKDQVNLLDYLKAPDFPTGGQILVNHDELAKIYQTGKGSFKIRARYRFDRKNSCIEVYEIPYTTTSEAIIESIAGIIKSGKIKDIVDVRDETDLDGLCIAIDIKRNADPDEIMNKLFRLTTLQDSFNCNFNILVDQKPMVLGIEGILDHWIQFRMNCIRRRCQFDIRKKTQRLHLLTGLAKILLDIDKAIAIIRGTEKDEQVVPNLMKGFGIDREQAEFIAEIKLRNLNREYILRQTADIEKLKKEIEDLKDIVAHDARVLGIICDELREIAKTYGADRKSEIVFDHEVEHITEDKLIEDYNVRLFLTREGYIKKIPLVSLRSSGDQKLKEEDAIIMEAETRNKADLLLFSNKAVVYKMKVHELADSKASMLGDYLPNILGLDPDERIICMQATDDYSGYLLFAFENGKVAKIPLSSYATKLNRRKLANAYSQLSPLVCIRYIAEDQDFAALSSIDKLLVFHTSEINPKSTRDSQGVQVLKSKKGSTLVWIKPLSELNLSDPEYYRAKVPAIGCYLKDEDKEDGQVNLFGI
ncbi:MAG TPA: DNA topoisomerase (ATP-hydrolyzing) subunit A [Thermoclostridium caenicola]|uniref:DNA topoisomerase (ATP-hydrolyzing) n=1 Tax=Thermoclostridium caenicola TaxID=659425 RepID=A0A1M6BHV1_9FIRM|nr:DNA topoisomerase (ATP-hydrolyzing) subunit A [Thermoclostridium caenicola]SHI48289.1 DNA gyrase subunit A [Thermoclostridium caenicola]HOK42891.1 DNA topoisomerase (ATP-hydrolyzing) subunit A [Thermoclostridium caenicola]HOL85047.1 DNA topoisomerase (ATP-hydrolyzing) subunit A [Thermoclostridium caenicola]HPO77179.1 DNA topoisomerase (ATP-hydrolyzing) subunit A [Thermoclostridium caenicola]